MLSAWSWISGLSGISLHAWLTLATLKSSFARGANNAVRNLVIRLAAVAGWSTRSLRAFFTWFSLASSEADAHVSFGSYWSVVSSESRWSFGANVTLLSRKTISSRWSGRSNLTIASGVSLLSLGSWGSVGGLSSRSWRTRWTGISGWSVRPQRTERARISLCTVATVEARSSSGSRRSRNTRYSVNSGEAGHTHFSPFSLGATGSVPTGLSFLSFVARQAFGSRVSLDARRT